MTVVCCQLLSAGRRDLIPHPAVVVMQGQAQQDVQVCDCCKLNQGKLAGFLMLDVVMASDAINKYICAIADAAES